MKTIQITMDEGLLARLDRYEETRRDGRSAVLRRAVAEYLKGRRKQNISESYRRAYGVDAGLGSEFEGWEKEGQWPKE
jgi:metal-responsive CopG/Arc/MetJ family transcriptional regulator